MPPRRTITGRSQDPRQRFAEELRALRDAKGVTLRQLAAELGWDQSQFSKMETGASLGGPEIVEALDIYYGTTPVLLALWEIAVTDLGRFRAEFRPYMELEAGAVRMWQYSPAIIPGLLQTPGYARELLVAGGMYEEEELASQVDARVTRPELVLGDGAPRFRSIISEGALRTPLRNYAEWRGQLEHLLHMSERGNITIHVLPTSVGLHALASTDVMFLCDEDMKVVAWVEGGYTGELVESNGEVERLQLRYDLVRDVALSPGESRQFIRQLLEEAPCEPST